MLANFQIRQGRKILCVALVAASALTHGQPIPNVVTSLADNGGDCPGSNCTLRAALARAWLAPTITFDLALGYPATITLTQGELMMSNDAIVEGPGADKLTISANDQSRIVSIDNGASVDISGLTLADGQVIGADGANGAPGTPAQEGGTASGGCIRVVSGAALHLLRVAVRGCLVIAGNGGIGESGEDVDALGGEGGDALGGAATVLGQLRMVESTIVDVSANAGNGGDGGNMNTTASFCQQGGRGGNGGDVIGGALYAGSFGTIEVINSSVLDIATASGRGGAGGACFPNGIPYGYDGGDGGDLIGGVVANNGTFRAAFSTLEAWSSTAGRGWFGGLSDSPFGSGDRGADGTIYGRVLHKSSIFMDATFELAGVALIDWEDLGASSCYPTMSAHATYATDNSCGSGVVAPARDSFSSSYRRFGGLDELPLAPSSILIDAMADCVDLDGAPVISDQAGRLRPIDGNGAGGAMCDIGAVERDNDRLFAHGFELPNYIQPVDDPSFEATDGTSGIFWSSYHNDPWARSLGGSMPHSGEYSVDFGGESVTTTGATTVSVEQASVVIKSGGPRYLHYWRRIDAAPVGTTSLVFLLDGTPISTVDLVAAGVDAQYTEFVIDVSAYADHAPHTLKIAYEHIGNGVDTDDGRIFLDDVTIEQTP